MAPSVAYFDYAATTPTDPRVVAEMMPYFGPDGFFGNPSSIQHSFGMAAAEAVELARKRVARSVGARSAEIVWTSGATEANNLALRGIIELDSRRKRQLVTLVTEHPAVLDTAKALRRQGSNVTMLPVRRSGIVDLDRLHASLLSGPALVSIMWVNNETGVIQPMPEIVRICKQSNAILHVDASQALGKLDVSTRQLGIDLMSMSAHKAYGPKGVGALFVRRGIRLYPLVTGGGQERGLRPGTLPTPLIVGMGKALEIAAKSTHTHTRQAQAWHDRVVQAIEPYNNVHINGNLTNKVPDILNISFSGIDGDIISRMPKVALSSSSACTTEKVAASHVLIGMGLTKIQALAFIRISFGRFTTDSQINTLIRELRKFTS